jgi:putative transposase
MDKLLKFIARLLEGEQIAPLGRESGISRLTGNKIFNRSQYCGFDALFDRSRAPHSQDKLMS